MFEKILLEKRNETNVFQLCCGKGKNLRWLRWFGWKNLESYVEMVAGLPKDTKMIKKNQMSMASRNTLKTIKLQC